MAVEAPKSSPATAYGRSGLPRGKPIPESRPARRAFNTPNAAGVSRDTDAGPD